MASMGWAIGGSVALNVALLAKLPWLAVVAGVLFAVAARSVDG